MRSKLLGLSVVMMTVLFGSLTGVKTAQAAYTDDNDAKNALATMPKGLPLSDYFAPGQYYDATGVGFTPEIRDSANSSSSGTQAMQLTADSYNGGASVWSKDGFKFNLYKDQKASMWLYFGNGTTRTVGDGMAFVLQNNSSGGTGTYSDKGQSLGVWGKDVSTDSNGTKTQKTIADSAIPKSWALEFDTFVNSAKPNGTDFVLPSPNPDGITKISGNIGALGPLSAPNTDANNKLKVANNNIADAANGYDANAGNVSSYPHIASNYPGEPSTYTLNSLGSVYIGGYKALFSGTPTDTQQLTYNWATLNHEGVLSYPNTGHGGKLSNGKWHHLSIDYKKATSTNDGVMTYTYDDKDPDTGAKQTNGTDYGALEENKMSQQVNITPSKLGASEANPTVWWGFTGSTGMASENNLVAFEQIPNLANINSSGTMTDTTTNKDVTDNATIQGNDHVKVNYNVSYESGTSAWENIKSKIAVPQNITYKTAKITYTKKSGATETVTLDPSDLSQNGIDLQLDHNLNNESDSDYVSADITLTGVAKNPSAQTTIAATTGSFTGTQAIASVDIPSFTIAPSTLNLQLDQSKVTASGDSDVQLTGKITSTATLDSNDKLILHPSINGNDLATSKLSTTDKPGIFTVSVPVKQLSSGENTFEVYATDSTGDSSNTGTVTITLGSLSFGTVSDSAAFKDTTLDGSQQTAGTNGDWNLNVQDTRAVGSQWTLSAKISQPFKVNDQALKGSLMYKTANGTEAITADNTPIVTHTKTASDSSTTNVAGSWNTDSGLLLDVGSSNTAGTYSGQLTWTLQDAPQ
ncbi:WxL domain-containing protein [Levilactobacillus brevis]|uniref:WxL domain-containing protein n=1 Tax=Levilactobacillus brevis TaxID=1580 RepID=UPI003D182A59